MATLNYLQIAYFFEVEKDLREVERSISFIANFLLQSQILVA